MALFSRKKVRMSPEGVTLHQRKLEGGEIPTVNLLSRDLPTFDYMRHKRVVEYLFRFNPSAQRLMKMIMEFALGTGAQVRAKDPLIHEWICDFMENPWNLWREKELERMRDGRLFGELAFLVDENEQTGNVVLTYLDTGFISEVRHDKRSPEILTHAFVSLPNMQRWVEIVNLVRDPLDPDYGLLRGKLLFFRFNAFSNSTRGLSDLFAVGDNLELMEKMISRTAVKVTALNQYFWDVTLQGATETEVRKKEQQILEQGPPDLGSVRIHNELEQWQAVAPPIRSQEQQEYARFLRNHNLGALGIPEHFFAEGTQENLATAKTMNTPVFKHFEQVQHELRLVYLTIFSLVRDRKIAWWQRNNELPFPQERDRTIEVVLPDLAPEDFEAKAKALEPLRKTLSEAVIDGWIRKETAAKLFLQALKSKGFEVDVDEELKAMGEDIAEELKGREGLLDRLNGELKAGVRGL